MSENKKETKSLSAREKIARLRKTFLAQLPDRIKQAEALFEQILADVNATRCRVVTPVGVADLTLPVPGRFATP